MLLPYVLGLTAREAYRGSTDARLLLGGVALVVLGVVHDVLVEKRVIHSILLMPFAFLAFILGIAIILANRFMRVHNEVEELNADLEQKVLERTDELNQTLSEVRELKQQQDGDYFLTAQLLHPLAGNHLSKNEQDVDAVYLSRQKKQFRFRHWESELGGDLCAIHSLQLRGRNVVAFFNGDAMGKSMQGAGGALIMGTIFKTIITRTQQSSRLKNYYPEQWLRQCYQELKSVLLAFDGRMLISVVVGLVDAQTGMLYFINAEHPHVVLLRDGRAEFVPEQGMLRKLGVDDPTEVFVVQTLLLEANDVILVGSDGRDDLLLGRTPDGQAIINEDERAFLADVQESEGRLDILAERIQRRGALTDDLSLIRIAYQEDGAKLLDDPASSPGSMDHEWRAQCRALYAARDFAGVFQLLHTRETEQFDRESLRMYLRACLETRHYADGVRAGELYTARHPADNEQILWYSYILSRCARPVEAIDAAERLLMRDPSQERYQKHLANLHRKYNRAE